MRTSFCSSVHPVVQLRLRTTSVSGTPTISVVRTSSNRHEEVEEAMLLPEVAACHPLEVVVLSCLAAPTSHQDRKSALRPRLATIPMPPSTQIHLLALFLEQAQPAAEADVSYGNRISRLGKGVTFVDGLIYIQFTMLYQRSY